MQMVYMENRFKFQWYKNTLKLYKTTGRRNPLSLRQQLKLEEKVFSKKLQNM